MRLNTVFITSSMSDK